jgi:hypothetical protein
MAITASVPAEKEEWQWLPPALQKHKLQHKSFEEKERKSTEKLSASVYIAPVGSFLRLFTEG